MPGPLRLAAIAISAAACLFACDDDVNVGNGTPGVSVVDYCAENGRVFVALDVSDFERDVIDVELAARLDGVDGLLAIGSAGDGVTGLTTERPVDDPSTGLQEAPPQRRGFVRHWVEWAPACDTSTCADGDCTPCIDPCNPGPPNGLSLLGACHVRPSDPPGTLSLTVYFSDEENQGRVEDAVSMRPEPCGRLAVEAP